MLLSLNNKLLGNSLFLSTWEHNSYVFNYDSAIISLKKYFDLNLGCAIQFLDPMHDGKGETDKIINNK